MAKVGGLAKRRGACMVKGACVVKGVCMVKGAFVVKGGHTWHKGCVCVAKGTCVLGGGVHGNYIQGLATLMSCKEMYWVYEELSDKKISSLCFK